MLITGGRESNDGGAHRVLVVDDAPEFIEIGKACSIENPECEACQ